MSYAFKLNIRAVFECADFICIKKLVQQTLTSSSTSSRRTEEVDTAVAVRVQEEGEGRDEMRK